MPSQQKIFIVGLPRTGTTSLCLAMLELGYRVAHTAYTDASLVQAQVLADTPVFCDYPALDRRFPGGKFIYLQRSLPDWLPSIRQLLQRMYLNLTRTDGGFNPTLKRCYAEVFAPLSRQNIDSDAFLTDCYRRHQQQVQAYFCNEPERLLSIDVSEANSYSELLAFLSLQGEAKSFERVNIGGKVTYWNQIKHPLKVRADLKR